MKHLGHTYGGFISAISERGMTYMTAAEFTTCLVLVDPASPAPMKGHVVVCVAFYERGFGVSSHLFLCSLLWSYGLELQHLTPPGILHMAAFVTL
jgi:hypothetical protein